MTLTKCARLLLIPTVLTVALASILSSGAVATPEQTPTQKEVQTALEEAVAVGVPGISLAIRSPEGGEFLAAGDASLEQPRPLGPEDRFRIASVTKAFTAAVVMQQIEEGRLSLDDTVQRWVPGLLAKGDSITVRNLLGHTSGLPEYTKDEKFLEAFTSGEDLSPREIVSFVSSEPLAFEPGTRYEYSDTDNIVLGLIIEAASGRSYEQELHSRILEPLGLQATTLPNSAQMPDPHAQGYQYDPEGGGAGKPENVTTALDPSAAWASGALLSTPGDVSSFFVGPAGRRAGRLRGARADEADNGRRGQSFRARNKTRGPRDLQLRAVLRQGLGTHGAVPRLPGIRSRNSRRPRCARHHGQRNRHLRASQRGRSARPGAGCLSSAGEQRYGQERCFGRYSRRERRPAATVGRSGCCLICECPGLRRT